MFGSSSLMTRIAIGKGIGFLFGLVGFFLLPVIYADATWLLRWGVLFWYTTLGAVIGVFGVFTWHPIVKIPMPWWLRSSGIGAWFNFVLVFFAYDQLTAIIEQGMGFAGVSPFWVTLEGALIGLVIGYVATRFGGEGKDIVEEKPLAA